jgi:tRNA pseudouridine55 synthase
MDGVLNIYKPVGMTSFDVVRIIRKISGTKKVGHTGTLDPLACGVLPVCLGKATKIVDYIMNGQKRYITTMRLGLTTDTYDREGSITSQSDVNISDEQVIDAVKQFVGGIMQVPPMYSAIKIKGQKLYDLARQGIDIDRPARPVTIYNINVLNIELPFVKMSIECSKGTYIRSLCYDIGKLLNCGGVMWELERSKTGTFDISNSIYLDNIDKDNISDFLIPMEQALADYVKIDFGEPYEKLLINGVNLCDENAISGISKDMEYRVYSKGRFLGLGKLNNTGFKMTKLLV